MAKKKLESNFLNMVVVLSVIALISSLALGFTYTLTKPEIDEGKRRKKEAAIKAVLPEFDTLKEMVTVDGFPGLELYPAEKNGEIVGTAIKTVSSKGFSGEVWIMVGFDKDGKIFNSSVLDHKETPGLGSKMNDAKFKDQFMGKDPLSFSLKVKKDGGSVDAITAATISSRAFCDAAQNAYDAWKKKGGN